LNHALSKKVFNDKEMCLQKFKSFAFYFARLIRSVILFFLKLRYINRKNFIFFILFIEKLIRKRHEIVSYMLDFTFFVQGSILTE
jgi:hypothetical protein